MVLKPRVDSGARRVDAVRDSRETAFYDPICPSIRYELRKIPRIDLREYDRKVQEVVSEWLATQKKLTDAHVHVQLPEDHAPLSEDRMLNTFAASQAQDFTLQELGMLYKRLFPDQVVDAIVFPFPFKETYVSRANEYILTAKHPFILIDLKHPEETCELLHNPKVLGLKVYSDLVDKPFKEIQISDMVPECVMETLNKTRKALMLHVPGSTNVGDPRNMAWLESACDTYPNVKILLAHMGRCATKEDAKIFEQLRKFKNVYVDTSYCTSPEVFQSAFESLGAEKMMLAFDFPYGASRAKEVVLDKPINLPRYGPTINPIISVEHYSYELPELRQYYLRERPQITYNAYEVLLAIISASNEVGGISDAEKGKLCSGTAEHAFPSIRKMD